MTIYQVQHLVSTECLLYLSNVQYSIEFLKSETGFVLTIRGDLKLGATHKMIVSSDARSRYHSGLWGRNSFYFEDSLNGIDLRFSAIGFVTF